MTEDEAWTRFYQTVRDVRKRCKERPLAPVQGRERRPRPPKPAAPRAAPVSVPVIRRPRFNRDGKLLLWMRRRDAQRVANFKAMGAQA